MKKRWWAIFLLPILMLGCSGGGSSGLQGFLPSSVKAQGIKIKKDGEARIYDGKKLFDYMDGGAELYYEYGFEQACVQRYKAKEGEVTVEIYQMDTPAHAYGVYTFDTQGEHPPIGQDATYARGLLSFWKGRYCVRALSENEQFKDILLAVGQAITKKIPQEGERPAILAFLPPQWVVGDSLLYFRGQISLNNSYFLSNQDVLLLGKGAEGITFQYKPEAQPLRVIMVRYAGRSQAMEAFKSLRSSGVIKQVSLKEGLSLGKSRKGYGGALLSEDIVVLVLDGKSRETVTRALRSLPYRGGQG
ncbi:MAG TPA: DUF6599 family protein [Thermodesulfobacteriota bacterium]